MVFGLSKAIKNARKNAIIAEIKVFSPKYGDLLRGRDPIKILRNYEENGATGISYITEMQNFHGNLMTFKKICKESNLPVLRKDFIREKEDIETTSSLGAAAVLLIARILQERLPEMVDFALEHGVEPLVEIHELRELKLVKDVSHAIIGINNRDIARMEKDDGSIEVTEKIAPLVPPGFLKISESGIYRIEQLKRALRYADAALIGTSLMLASEPGEMLKHFVEEI